MPEDIRCPICGSETVERTATKGKNVGRSFYVCNRYPECKGKAEIPVDEDTEGFLVQDKEKKEVVAGQGYEEKYTSKKPIIAGILLALCGLWLFFLTFVFGDINSDLSEREAVEAAPYMIALIGGTAIAGIVVLAAGISAISRKGYVLCIVASIISILAMPPLGIPALLLIISSRAEIS